MVRFIVSVAGLCVSSTALMAGGMKELRFQLGLCMKTADMPK